MAQVVRIFSSDLTPVGRQALTIDSTAGGVALTIATGATIAVCRLETAEVRFTLDGTTSPTVSVGMLLEPLDFLELCSYAEMSRFKAIRTGATSGILQIEYLKIG